MTSERTVTFWWWSVAAVVTFVVAFASMNFAEAIPTLLLVLTPVTAWLLLRRHFNSAFLSPVTIVAGFFFLIGVMGYLFRGLLATAGGRGASIAIVLTEEAALNTLRILMASSLIIILVSALVLAIVRFAQPGATQKPSRISWEAPKVPGLLLLASAIPLVLIVLDVGVPDILERSYYILGERGSVMGSLGGLLATAAVLVLGYAFGAARGGGRFVAVLLLMSYVVLLLSYGSRRFALVPILFAVGVFIAQHTKRSRRGIIFAAILTFLLLPLPLEFRSSSTHGFIPYVQAFTEFSFSDVDWLGALNNILVAFPIIGASAFGTVQVTMADIVVSLNPMPGTSAGWYDIYQRLRLNSYTPTAGVGELWNVGPQAAIPFFIGLGLALAWVELAVRRQLVSGSLPWAGALVGVAGLFALQMVQYNLRSASRILVYLIVAEVARRIISRSHASLSTGHRKESRRPKTTATPLRFDPVLEDHEVERAAPSGPRFTFDETALRPRPRVGRTPPGHDE